MSARPRAESSLTRLWLPALVMGVAALVRFYALGRSSFWSDEGNTWALVQRGWGEIAAAAAADIHPPGYYWLLKGWGALFGASPAALRGFSALYGLLLVGLIWALGRRVARAGSAHAWLPLGAAWLAALLPFQVFYSQEARMYMQLALLAALLFLILLHLPPYTPRTRRTLWLLAAWALVAAAGLWTHYVFPVLLAAAGLAWLMAWLRSRPLDWRDFGGFALANAAALLAFAPWMGIAWRQVSSWPQGGEAIGLAAGGRLVLHTLLFGLVRTPPQPTWPWLLAAALLPLLGIVALRRNRALPALLLWLGAPLLLMAGLGLFTQAFLKFLLAASAPWCLLVAAAPEAAPARARSGARVLLAAGALALALLTLPGYFADPNARDNYKGFAAWLGATADPATEIVLLNAPGQADVWGLYDPGLPVLALPAQRPPDSEALNAALEAGTAGKQAVHALLWATDEADPEGRVEAWLDAHFFRGAEQWLGDVRAVSFFAAPEMVCHEFPPGPAEVLLVSYCLPAGNPAPTVAAGAALPLTLDWSAPANLAASAQLLDARGLVVAQIDAPLTAPADRRALAVPFGTPPGAYRLLVALYDPATGARVPLTGAGEVAELGHVTIARPAQQPPADLLPMAVRVQRDFGAVRLIGYTQHKAGFAHAPETPLAPGDRLHVTLYWQVGDVLSYGWPADATFTLRLGENEVTLPLAGGAYPTARWQPGEIVRVEAELPVSATAARATVAVGEDTFALRRFPR